jgi:hypothetical protein
MNVRKILSTIIAQLPDTQLHGLGTITLLATLGLLGYYEYVGNAESAQAVLLTLLGLILPAPFRSRNDAALPVDAENEAEKSE